MQEEGVSGFPFKISDFRTVCHNCNQFGDKICEYWLHPAEYYGNSYLQRNYCDACVRSFYLYDGRTETLCVHCMNYVEVFLAFPKVLQIMQEIHKLAEAQTDGDVERWRKTYNERSDISSLLKSFFSDAKERDQVIANLNLDEILQWLKEQ